MRDRFFNRRQRAAKNKRRANARYMLGMLPPMSEKVAADPTLRRMREELEDDLRREIERPDDLN